MRRKFFFFFFKLCKFTYLVLCNQNGHLCVCVCVCARARMLKIVSMDKILRFINTLLLLEESCIFQELCHFSVTNNEKACEHLKNSERGMTASDLKQDPNT